MTIVSIGEWLPDLPAYANPGATVAENVYPRTKSSYGPMPTPAVYSGALGARCQGSLAFLDKTAATHIFAGDATKLYRLTAGSTAFADVSRTAGGAYATGSALDPAAPTIPFWCITPFGERIIATNYADAPQTFLVGTDSNFSLLSSAAPNHRFGAVVRDFYMAGYTSDPSNGVLPRRVWWSALGNPLSWPTLGTAGAEQVQSDAQDLEQSDLGQMTGLIGGHLASADGLAFMERGVYRITYAGSPTIFDFKVAEGAAGTTSPLSIALCRALGNTAVAMYLGTDGFYAHDGMSGVAIGVNKLDRTFFDDLDTAYLSAVQGVADPTLPLVYWLYNSATGSGAGLYDRMLVYNTVLGRWAFVDLTATPAEWITRAMTFGKTLDQLDALYGTLDAIDPVPLDSSIFLGGRPRVALFDGSHKLNFLTGPNMAATCDTGEAQPTSGRRSKILSARALIDGGSTHSVSIGVRDRLMDSVTYEAAVPVNVIGECPQRITGRYARARFTIPAGETWQHLQGIEIDARPEGRR